MSSLTISLRRQLAKYMQTILSNMLFLFLLKKRQLPEVRGLSKKFVEFVIKNKTTIPIAFKFV